MNPILTFFIQEAMNTEKLGVFPEAIRSSKVNESISMKTRKSNKRLHSKIYNPTTDSQRHKLIHMVKNCQLTIHEVKQTNYKFAVGCY